MGRSTVATASSGHHANHSLFIFRDRNSGKDFLIDTGAAVSVFPASPQEQTSLRPNLQLLQAANGTPVPTYGKKSVSFEVAGSPFSWSFIVGKVSRPLVGADFLRHSGLLVDVRNKRLIEASTGSAASLAPVKHRDNLTVFEVVPADQTVSWIRTEFPDLIRPTFKDPVVKHGVTLPIVTSGPPVFAKARRLPPDKLALAKEAFQSMLDAGIVRRSDSAWASPLHLVRKDDGSWRPCGDFRQLNTRTADDKYPVPHIMDFSAQLHGKTVFSRVDLVKGYHQVPVAPEDVHKTAVITPFGLFEFLRTPFGLKNAAQAFQRLMDSVCQGFSFVFVYLDDILVASRDVDEHRDHLRQLFRRLQDAGLILNLEKCAFGRKELRFLGHVVSPEGILPTEDGVAVIKAWTRPKTIRDLMSFLGTVNFYKRFIRHSSRILAPLHAATSGAQSKSALAKEIEWTPEMVSAFDKIKAVLAKATRLIHFTPGAPLALTTDASDFAVGGVVEQLVGGHWQPLAFFSKKFKPSQVELKRPMQLEDHERSATDRELLAAYRAIQHFRYLLEGRPFTLYTDHAPLVGMMNKSTDTRSAMQARHMASISEFTTDVRHLSGKSNVVADALSRIPVEAVSLGLDIEELAAAQRDDPDLLAARTSLTDLDLQDRDVEGISILGDCSGSQFRPWIPAALRRTVFDMHHGLSHPGVKASVRLLSSRVVWHGMKRDVTQWARQCPGCQCSKVSRHTKPALDHLPMPDCRFGHVHVDLVGPLPPSEGHTHLLTVVDRFTRWPEAIPLRSIEAASVAQAFALGWVARFGVPEVIVSDRGPQFVSALWRELSATLGSQVHHTTAYHPQSNGMVERMHRQLKAALTARLRDQAWIRQLPWVLLGIRTAVKEDLGCSPDQLVFGQQLRLPGHVPGDRVPPDPSAFGRELRQALGQLRPVPTHHHRPASVPDPYVPQELRHCPLVWLRREGHHAPLTPKYDGPYQVLHRGPKVFRIRLGDREDTVSVDRLKPALVAEDTAPAEPRRRGRPPGPSASPRTPAAVSNNPSSAPPTATQEPTSVTTRSGRVVRTPARFVQSVWGGHVAGLLRANAPEFIPSSLSSSMQDLCSGYLDT